jgi:hypothetical protein
MPFSIMTFSIMAFGIVVFRTMTFSMTALDGLMELITLLSTNDTQHKDKMTLY